MLAVEQCSTCEMVTTGLDSEECIPTLQTVKLELIKNHEDDLLSGKFHDREAQRDALSNLESARTHFDSSKLRISFNR